MGCGELGIGQRKNGIRGLMGGVRWCYRVRGRSSTCRKWGQDSGQASGERRRDRVHGWRKDVHASGDVGGGYKASARLVGPKVGQGFCGFNFGSNGPLGFKKPHGFEAYVWLLGFGPNKNK